MRVLAALLEELWVMLYTHMVAHNYLSDRARAWGDSETIRYIMIE